MTSLRSDGRKILNGQVETTQDPQIMWNDLLTKSAACKIQSKHINENNLNNIEREECNDDAINYCGQQITKPEESNTEHLAEDGTTQYDDSTRTESDRSERKDGRV
ncbi:unnamed protein product [Anisakis simplex]|uniref:Uncharacterized protein n=1 Tax=Anisakis simplex TaxID=6269 RepID=A0A0M3JWM1_ANISI|nr:unnamed protein product [Anisakis simplex]